MPVYKLKHITKNYSNLKGSILLVLVFGASLAAQPENPGYSLSSSTFFDINMKSIALVDIETNSGTGNFTMEIPAITEAGLSLGANPLATNSDNWLNFSCAVRDVVSRNIEVSVSTGSLPSMLELKLDVGAASGMGGGTLGVPAGSTITLAASPHVLISGIRGSFTGDGANNGYQLNYSLHYTGADFDQLESEDIQVTILYTIVDN